MADKSQREANSSERTASDILASYSDSEGIDGNIIVQTIKEKTRKAFWVYLTTTLSIVGISSFTAAKIFLAPVNESVDNLKMARLEFDKFIAIAEEKNIRSEYDLDLAILRRDQIRSLQAAAEAAINSIPGMVERNADTIKSQFNNDLISLKVDLAQATADANKIQSNISPLLELNSGRHYYILTLGIGDNITLPTGGNPLQVLYFDPGISKKKILRIQYQEHSQIRNEQDWFKPNSITGTLYAVRVAHFDKKFLVVEITRF